MCEARRCEGVSMIFSIRTLFKFFQNWIFLDCWIVDGISRIFKFFSEFLGFLMLWEKVAEFGHSGSTGINGIFEDFWDF
jgi:hypothetical protein